MFRPTATSLFRIFLAAFCIGGALWLGKTQPAWSADEDPGAQMQEKLTFEDDEDDVEEPTPKNLTLMECLRLALNANRTIKIAQMDRTAQKFSVKVAEDKFMPHGQFVSGITYDSPGRYFGGPSSAFGQLFPTITWLMPTGSEMRFTWLSSRDNQTSSLLNSFSGLVAPTLGTLDRTYGYGSGLDLTVRQPLLKGAGAKVNTASVTIARLEDQINFVSLKSTMIDIITSVIVAYRRLQQAQQQVEINQLAVRRAKELLDINQTLISLGRLPALEIVQTDRNVTSRELAVVSAKREVDAARLALIDLLDIAPKTPIVAADGLRVQPVSPDIAHLQEVALQNQPAYQQVRLQAEIAQQNELLAKNKKLWDLSLVGGYSLLGTGTRFDDTLGDMGAYAKKDWRVGIALTIPIRDLTLDQNVVATQVASRQAKVRVEEMRHHTEVAVRDAVRDVEVRLRQSDLARGLRELSEKQLAVEQEKLRVGHSSIFQLVNYQDDLLEAQLREVETTVSYLNTLTALDQTLGSTLDTWQINMHVD